LNSVERNPAGIPDTLEEAMHAQRRLLLLSLVAALGCAGHAQTPHAAPRNSRVIDSQELSTTHASNLYEAVQFLRPGWLRNQGAVSLGNDGYVVVYLNDTRLGPPESLRQVVLARVSHLRFYDPVSAQATFGLNHSHGAIQVILDAGR
jgi:hypothetical protein